MRRRETRTKKGWMPEQRARELQSERRVKRPESRERECVCARSRLACFPEMRFVRAVGLKVGSTKPKGGLSRVWGGLDIQFGSVDDESG